MSAHVPWWKRGVVYQIYPRSFADSDGDGIGDLPGITRHLGYLAELGVSAIWLSPFYPSPMKDFGYDVSDYCAVDPSFGSMRDFDVMVAAAHEVGIHVIIDLVMNHTSNEHPWFVESRSSRENPKRDWYLWRDGREGGDKPPNNWTSVFGGPAWERDPKTGQWYLHLFDESQPDLNWRNPEVKRAFEEVWRFWLDRGVDGFRLDVAHMLVKHADLPDHPSRFGLRDYDRQRHDHHENREETHALWRDFRKLLDGYPGDRMAVGEVDLLGKGAERYYGAGADELHLAFNFGLLWIPFRASEFQRIVLDWERRLPEGAWPCWVLSNHDVTRHISRWGRFGPAEGRARVAACALLTLRGTPFLYYGEELGMRQAWIPRAELRDPPGIRYWPVYRGRDGCRTPMQWTEAADAGFGSSKPWMRLGPAHRRLNVVRESKDPGSLLHLYGALLRLRAAKPALQLGTFTPLDERPGPVWRYLREHEGQRVLVCLNFSRFDETARLADGEWRILLSSARRGLAGDVWAGEVELLPHECVVLEPVDATAA